jgi:hypothetical protein
MRFSLRRLALVGTVLAALALLMNPALAGADDDDDDEGGSSGVIADFTFGSGTASFAGVPGQSQFTFDAESGPNGENATGFAEATSVFGVTFTGPVTCLRVVGNRAAFEVDSNVPFDVVFFVGDNGVGTRVDEYNFHPLAEGADGSCPDPNSNVSERSVDTGDIVVGDNQPLPGSGEDDHEDSEDDDDG